MSNLKGLMPFVAILALIAACGGSSSGGSDSGSGTATVTSVSEIPDDVINPQAYDLTTQSASLSAPIDKSISKGGEVGAWSRAGCEADTMKKNIIRNAILPRMILCNIKAFEAAAGGTAAGSGTFNYWKMNPPEGVEGPGGVDEFAPRVAIKLDGNVLTFVMCNNATKSMELVIDASDNAYSGHVIDKWGEGFQGQLDFTADGKPTDATFTNATFTQSFSEVSDFFTGYGSMTLEATPTDNIVRGFNSGSMPGNGGSFAGSAYAKFDVNDGTAKYKMDSGTYPGQTVAEAYNMCVAEGHCEAGGNATDWIAPGTGWLVNGNPCSLTGLTTQSKLCWGGGNCPSVADENGLCDISGSEDSESFTINNTNPLSLVFTVEATSTYAADVAAATMPSSATSPTIEFTSASAGVDCSASDSWTALTFQSEPDMTECIAMEQELNNWQSSESCANQQSQNDAGDVPQ